MSEQLTTDTQYPTADPRHTFLTRPEVFARYKWGRSKGYEITARADFPRSIGGVYRLDTLIAWEEAQLAVAAPPASDVKRGPGRPRKVTATLGTADAPLGQVTLVPAATRLAIGSPTPRTTRATGRTKGAAA